MSSDAILYLPAFMSLKEALVLLLREPKDLSIPLLSPNAPPGRSSILAEITARPGTEADLDGAAREAVEGLVELGVIREGVVPRVRVPRLLEGPR